MTDYSHTSGSFNRPLLLALALITLVIYVYRLDFIPPRWEEPRRCTVAFEMIERGNYAVPTVYNELYTKKPPLQNWLIALFAGFDVSRIRVLIPRAMTVFSVFAIAAILIGLARNQRRPWLAGAIFLTLGIMVQYGRSAAIDPLFVLWTTGALATFYLGVQRDNRWLIYVVPQLLVGLG
ncbi:MAG: glycosyltransferase family 39 protein, partial [Myxococcota bacterium]